MTPKELFRFVEGEQVWTLTSADEDETYNGEVYISTTLGRNEIENKNQMSRANVEITLALENEMAHRWMRQTVEAVVSLTIFAKSMDEVVGVSWKGRLASVKPDGDKIVLIFESIFTSLRRPGLRARYQRACRHVLYGRGCNLNKDDFASYALVTAVSGLIVTVPGAAAQPNGFFTGGMIEGPDGVLRFITNHTGATLTLIRELDSLTPEFLESGQGYGHPYGGSYVRLFPGCARDRATCDSKFNNLDNFGGFPFIPTRNPFDGSSIV